MTTTYQVKPTNSRSEPYQVFEDTTYHYSDSEYQIHPDNHTKEMVFKGTLTDCAAFIQLRKNGHI